MGAAGRFCRYRQISGELSRKRARAFSNQLFF
jgi:hypothetical protein